MKLAALVIVVEAVIIAFLLLDMFVLAPMQFQSSNGTSSGSLSKSPGLVSEIKSSKDVLNDLTLLGCTLTNVSYSESKLSTGLVVTNYSDFRRIAYNTKLVFYDEEQTQSAYFTTYQGITVIFSLSETSNQSSSDASSFRLFEELKFTSIYADPASHYDNLLQPDGMYFSGTAFAIYITLKNTGTATATITGIFLNARPYDTAYANVTQRNVVNQTLAAGQTLTPKGTITLPVDNSHLWTSGNVVEVEIKTAAGQLYTSTVVLP